MNIYVTRHGQTRLNAMKIMQGLTDEPLNETGIDQAKRARQNISDVTFDAVYSSPLIRAVKTASIVGNVDESEIIRDERIIEVNFGHYEGKSYYGLGPMMTLYWMLPEVFPCPKDVENIDSMVARVESFLSDLEQQDYENVLIVCHGGIIRAICGVLENAKRKIVWRPKPTNCEIRVYEKTSSETKLINDFVLQ